jgi:hypothetical protein
MFNRESYVCIFTIKSKDKDSQYEFGYNIFAKLSMSLHLSQKIKR